MDINITCSCTVDTVYACHKVGTPITYFRAFNELNLEMVAFPLTDANTKMSLSATILMMNQFPSTLSGDKGSYVFLCSGILLSVIERVNSQLCTNGRAP